MDSNQTIPEQTSGLHNTYWLETSEPITFEKLHENLKTDVVIVGGGIAGLSVAYSLITQGKKVVIVEDGNLGSGETGRTSAHLTAALDNRYYEIEKLFGKDGAKHAAESHMAAIGFVEQAVSKESIDCAFTRVPGYLFPHASDKEESLQREYEAAERAGLRVKIMNYVPGFPGMQSSCIEFANQAQFHPMKYLHGLSDAIRRKGGRIFTNTHAKEINAEGIKTDEGFAVQADHIVVATNSPVNNMYILPLKQFSFRTYIIGALVDKDLFPNALWWDTGNFNIDSTIPPYHYIRKETFNDNFDLLIVGGEDHATGLADAQEIPEQQRYDRLEAWLKDKMEYHSIIYRWSGQVMEPLDSMAYIGHNPMDKPNIYIVTGDSGNGLTHGSLAGILIPDLIFGKENPWQHIYEPSRFKLRSLSTWVKEFGGGFFDYLNMNPHHVKDVELTSIPKGEGKIIQLDKEKYGAYRDENDQLHFVTAECSHLKCIVKWNNDEKSWDCPCHGSRFTYKGKVLNGPANFDLFYWTEEDKHLLRDVTASGMNSTI